MFNSFMHFSQGQTIFMTLAGVDSLVLRGKIRSSSVVVQDFCSLPVRAHRCRAVSSSAHWKLVSYRFLALVRINVARFSKVFCKGSNALFYLSWIGVRLRITENGLLGGSEGRKWSMAAPRWISLMKFCKLMKMKRIYHPMPILVRREQEKYF